LKIVSKGDLKLMPAIPPKSAHLCPDCRSSTSS
jgi:hypothetical protein